MSWYAIRKHSAVASAVLAAAAGTAAKSSAEVLIYGEIGDSWFADSVSAADFVKEIAALDVEALTVRINSTGGSVPDGIAIHNAIKRHPAKVTTVNDGWACSIASLVMCAGDVKQMAENAQFMVHAPWTIALGNAPQLRDAADMLESWASSMSVTYASATGKKPDEMKALLDDGKDHWYTAEEAKAAGFIDEVVSGSPAAAMASADLSRFRDVPERVRALFPNRTAAPAATPAAAAATPTEQSTMDEKEKAAAEAKDAAIKAAREQGARDEAQRRIDITAAFKPFLAREGMQAAHDALIADHAATAVQANARILEVMARGAEPAAGGYPKVETVADERDKRIEAMSQSVLARAAARDEKGARIVAGTANPYRGTTLYELAKACAVSAGVRVDGMDKMQVVAAAFTQGTSDFPILLENTMHKTLLGAYALQPDTWTRFCATGSVSDFRAHKRYQTGSLGDLLSVGELEEFKNIAIPDGEKQSVSISTKGYIINISRQTIINDDLGAFVGLSASMGRAAKRSVEKSVYTSLALNSGMGPALSDGNPIFHASHSNISTGAAISVTALDLDRQNLATQLDVGGNDYLDLRPEILLVPLTLGSTARELNAMEYNDESNKQQRRPNVVRGLFRDIVDTPRLSGTRRYIFANPSEAPVLEVSFLDGNMEPFMENEMGFDVDGSRWKVRLDWGVNGVGYRGAVTNAGA